MVTLTYIMAMILAAGFGISCGWLYGRAIDRVMVDEPQPEPGIAPEAAAEIVAESRRQLLLVADALERKAKQMDEIERQEAPQP